MKIINTISSIYNIDSYIRMSICIISIIPSSDLLVPGCVCVCACVYVCVGGRGGYRVSMVCTSMCTLIN